jgi:hypothetical protein
VTIKVNKDPRDPGTFVRTRHGAILDEVREERISDKIVEMTQSQHGAVHPVVSVGPIPIPACRKTTNQDFFMGYILADRRC